MVALFGLYICRTFVFFVPTVSMCFSNSFIFLSFFIVCLSSFVLPRLLLLFLFWFTSSYLYITVRKFLVHIQVICFFIVSCYLCRVCSFLFHLSCFYIRIRICRYCYFFPFVPSKKFRYYEYRRKSLKIKLYTSTRNVSNSHQSK